MPNDKPFWLRRPAFTGLGRVTARISRRTFPNLKPNALSQTGLERILRGLPKLLCCREITCQSTDDKCRARKAALICRSGLAREKGTALPGTGYTRVRGTNRGAESPHPQGLGEDRHRLKQGLPANGRFAVCSPGLQGGVKVPTGGKSKDEPASAPAMPGVSRSGATPEPTVIVRMKEGVW